MADLLEELERSWQTAPRGGGIEAELERSWQQQPQPQPAPTGGGVLPQFVTDAIQWIQNNPDVLVDMGAQGVTTALGTVAGAPGGLPGMMAGGAAGNVAGRGIGHDINRWLGLREGPPLGTEALISPEAAIDAAVGAAGPAVAPLARGAVGALGRTLTGTRGEAGRQALLDQMIDLAGASGSARQHAANIAAGATPGVEDIAAVTSAQAAPRARASRLASEASHPTRLAGPVALAIEIFSGHVDPVRAAGYLAAATGGGAVHETFARRLLMSPKAVEAMRTTLREATTQDLSERALASRMLQAGLAAVGQQVVEESIFRTPQGGEVTRDERGRFKSLGER